MSSENKKNNTQISEVFSIRFDDGEVPGVTQLLNPKKMAEKAAEIEREQKSAVTLEKTGEVEIALTMDTPQASPTPAPHKNSAPESLTSLGVLYEIQFYLEAGHYRFQQAVQHATNDALASWQKALFSKMKFVPDFFEMKDSFTEFKKEAAVVFDALGVSSECFIQCVRAGQPPAYTVLISRQSLSSHRQILLQVLNSEKPGVEDKIELDLAS